MSDKKQKPEYYQLCKQFDDYFFDYGGDDMSNAFMALCGIALLPWRGLLWILDTSAYPFIFVERCWWSLTNDEEKEGENEAE